MRESFNPESYELDKGFRLTRFTELKGTGCKVPQDVLQKLLECLHDNHFQEDEQFLGAVMPRLGMSPESWRPPLVNASKWAKWDYELKQYLCHHRDNTSLKCPPCVQVSAWILVSSP